MLSSSHVKSLVFEFFYVYFMVVGKKEKKTIVIKKLLLEKKKLQPFSTIGRSGKLVSYESCSLESSESVRRTRR
jgi:hypothetical protein